jgi:hypothetical protein
MRRFDFGSFDFFSNTSSKKNADKQRRGRQCRIEELEGREMLSVSPWSLATAHIDLQPDFYDSVAETRPDLAPNANDNGQAVELSERSPPSERTPLMEDLPAYSGTVAAKQTFFPQEVTLTFDVAADKYYQLAVYVLDWSDEENGTIQNAGNTADVGVANPNYDYADWYRPVREEANWTVYAGADGNLRLDGASCLIVGTHAGGKATWVFDGMELYFSPYGYTIAEVDADGTALTAKSTHAVAWTRCEPLEMVGGRVESTTIPGTYDITLKLPDSLVELITSNTANFLTQNIGGTVVPTLLAVRDVDNALTTGYQFGKADEDGVGIGAKLAADFDGIPSNGLDLLLAFNKENGTYTVSGIKADINYEFFYRLAFGDGVFYGCAGLNGTLQQPGFIFSGLIPVSAVPATPLPAPSITAVTPTADSVSLSWTGVSGATDYVIQCRTVDGTWQTRSITATGTGTMTVNVTGLAPTTEYEFRVRAANASEASAWSAILPATTTEVIDIEPFGPPKNLGISGAATETSVNLEWDTVSDVTSYQIRYSADGGKSWTMVTVGGTVTTTPLNGLAAGTKYEFQIRALKAEGGKTVEVTNWAKGGSDGTVKQETTTLGTQNPADKKSKPAKVKAGNGSTTPKSTIDTISLELPALSTQKQPGAVAYVIEIDITKLPKKWNGITLTDAEKADLVKDATISIVGNVATITGLPAGLKVPFIVKTVDAAGQLSAPLAVSASTAK